MRLVRKLLPAILTSLLLIGVAAEAAAIIGMPLTPMSYAGVARRTVRRSAYYSAAVGAPSIYSLPPGCAVGVPCGGVNYTRVYNGGTVVYVAQ